MTHAGPYARRGEAVGALADGPEQLGLSGAGEGRVATEEDEGDDTETPHVHRVAVPLTTKDLRGDVAAARTRVMQVNTRGRVRWGWRLAGSEARTTASHLGVPQDVSMPLGRTVRAKPMSAILIICVASSVLLSRMFSGCTQVNSPRNKHTE